MSEPPLFVSLEGLRGVGKSTVAPLLAQALDAELVPTVPSSFQAARAHVDHAENVEARMCLYLAALFDAADHIGHLLEEGAPVVVESYFARCLATHRAMGAQLRVVLPPNLPQLLSCRLTCGETERQRRLTHRAKATTHWDALAESATGRINHAYDHFPMTAIDTTTRTPDQVVIAILDHLKEAPPMQTTSLWEHTLTFFPQFARTLNERTPAATVAVIGASDGKFVLPLAAVGHRVIAVERDPLALHGGDVTFPDGTKSHSPGLTGRLKTEGLAGRVDIVEGDFLDPPPHLPRCDAVWTSCSWHYSVNHHLPLQLFIARMQDVVGAVGLFGAEFMMPVAQRHHLIEHYTSPERLMRYFDATWQILLTLRTGIFTEAPHVGQPHPHQHRMGLLLAARH